MKYGEVGEKCDNKNTHTTTATDPDERLDLNDVMNNWNHEKLFLGFHLLLVPTPRIHQQVEHWVRGDLPHTVYIMTTVTLKRHAPH